MKKVFTIGFALCSIVFLLSNFTFPKSLNFVMTSVDQELVLPETPFSYDDANFPEHLFDDIEAPDIGYGGGGRDTFALSILDNDKATLGRVLFYDEKLSAMENISCASCHHQELSFTENKSFSEGINSDTRRNSMHLNDLGWSNRESFTWAMEQTDLHEMIIIPLTDENEIGANINEVKIKLEDTEYYSELFFNAYGDIDITEARIVDALVQFITSMTTFNSRFDEQVKVGFEDFTAAEFFGLELFAENCNTCHNQGGHAPFGIPFIPLDINPLEIFPEIFSNGLPRDEDDLGAGEWDPIFADLYKIPTLRNIELTAPYMHDGRFSSLEEVLDHYAEGIEQNSWSGIIPSTGFQFNEAEKEALIAFMKTLTDDTFITNPRWSDPFQEVVDVENISFESMKLAPNPTSDVATISFSNDGAEMVSINIINNEGRLLKHDQFYGSEYQIEKNDYPAGIYHIQLLMGDRRANQKLIVQ